MRVISCRNFRKKTLQRQSLTSIATGLVILLFLLLMIHSNDVDVDEEDFTICDGFDDKTLASFLRPDRDTAIIIPKFINAINERKFLASFVISSPENIESRQIIRKTWGSIIKPLFLIGKSENDEKYQYLKNEIMNEANEFDDIILEDFIDSYENLTIKTGFAMKNFIRYFNDSTYFMKIDEDVILNVDKLYKILKNQVPKATLVGALTDVTRPIRDINDKWFIPKCQYQKEFYPKYLQGAMYLIPGWDTQKKTYKKCF
jgi:beta-1,3-galactosyltransferase 1